MEGLRSLLALQPPPPPSNSSGDLLTCWLCAKGRAGKRHGEAAVGLAAAATALGNFS